MTVEQIAKMNDISMWAAATGLANLIERGLVEPTTGSSADAVAELRATAEAYRPGRSVN